MNKRIVIMTLSLSGGGAERVVSILSSRAAEQGEDVHVIIYEHKEKEYPVSEKVKVHVLSKDKGNNKFCRLYNRICGLKKLLKEIKPDVVIPFLALPTVHAYLATRGLRVKFIATVRNNPELYPHNKKLRNFVNWITQKADGIMLQTRAQESFFVKHKGKCFVVCNPVKQEMLDAQYEFRKDVKTIATFGRLNQQKNHELLINAFAQIAAQYPNIVLNIWGDGEEKQRLNDLIIKKNLENRVFLKGNTPAVKDEMLKTDIFVLSSDYEGLPNALMEAMAVGVPCISTDCPTGPRDLMKHNEFGLLVPIGDIDSLVVALMRMCDDYELRQRLGRLAKQELMDKYNEIAILDEFLKAI